MEVSMKQKKFVIVSAVLLLSAVSMFADTILSVGPAFTNYFVQTKIEGSSLDSAVAHILSGSLENTKDEKNNAAGFALDWRGELFYLMAQMAFPGKTHSDIFKSNSEAIKQSAIILDTQLGVGVTLFKQSQLNLFLGAGAGLNTMYANQSMQIPLAGTVSYAKLDFMVGAGANVIASLFLTKNIGIYAGIADTLYFLPIMTEKEFTIGGQKYKLDNKAVKNNWANSVNVKAGLTIKL